MTDTFDAVLAEMRKIAPAGWAHIHGSDIDGWADRLAAAHEREVDNLRRVTRHEHIAAEDAIKRAEAAEGLLREALPFVDTCPDLTRPGGDELHARIDAYLSGAAKP